MLFEISQGTYLTYAAKSHAVSCNISEESAIGSFNGVFWGVYASNQVLNMFCPLQSLQASVPQRLEMHGAAVFIPH